MRSVRSFYIRYRLAAAHVHCARPVGHGTDSFIFCLDRSKEINAECPGEASNLDIKSLRNQSLNTVGLLSYPKSYPRELRAGVRPLGICWARMSRLVTLGTAFTHF